MNPATLEIKLVQCCVCLRVRKPDAIPDDHSVWVRVHRRLPVSHGLCPSCALDVMHQLEQQTADYVTSDIA